MHIYVHAGRQTDRQTEYTYWFYPLYTYTLHTCTGICICQLYPIIDMLDLLKLCRCEGSWEEEGVGAHWVTLNDADVIVNNHALLQIPWKCPSHYDISIKQRQTSIKFPFRNHTSAAPQAGFDRYWTRHRRRWCHQLGSKISSPRPLFIMGVSIWRYGWIMVDHWWDIIQTYGW